MIVLRAHLILQTEVDLLSKIQHPNIISLLGYSIQGDSRLLVYELMENGSLETQLHGETLSGLKYFSPKQNFNLTVFCWKIFHLWPKHEKINDILFQYLKRTISWIGSNMASPDENRSRHCKVSLFNTTTSNINWFIFNYWHWVLKYSVLFDQSIRILAWALQPTSDS